MELKSLVIFSIFIFCVSCNKNEGLKDEEKLDNDLSKEYLSGKIKSITSITYDAKEKFGELEKISKSQEELIEYNDKGFKSKVTSYDSKGNIDYTAIFLYDQHNNIIEHSFPSLSTYKYDKQNLCIQKDELTDDRKLKFRSLNKYNSDSKLQEQNTYDKNGVLHSKSIYKYDAKGNEVEESVYKSNGDLWWKIAKTYDNLGNMIAEEDIQDMFGEKGSKMLYDYDKQKKVVKTTYINPDGTTRYVRDTKYDFNKNIISENSVSDDFMNQFTTEYSYSFDSHNNWINRKEKSIGPMERKTIVERKIQYFPE